MGKFKVDFDEDKEVFWTRQGSTRFEHRYLGSLIGQLREEYKKVGKKFPGYSATRKAQNQYS
jgi:hypothetical protein